MPLTLNAMLRERRDFKDPQEWHYSIISCGSGEEMPTLTGIGLWCRSDILGGSNHKAEGMRDVVAMCAL